MSNVISDDYFSDRNIEKIKEESRKQGAVEELKNTLKDLNRAMELGYDELSIKALILVMEKRLLELKGEQK